MINSKIIKHPAQERTDMPNSKITKQPTPQSSEEKLFKMLESIDWKLWEMYNIMKDNIKPTAKSKIIKTPPKKST